MKLDLLNTSRVVGCRAILGKFCCTGLNLIVGFIDVVSEKRRCLMIFRRDTARQSMLAV